MIAVLAAVFGLGVAVPPVAAHYVYEDERVAHYEGQCVFDRSEISHGNNNNGYSKVDMSFLSDVPEIPYSADCISQFNSFASKTKMSLRLSYSANGSTNWGTCADLGSKEATDNTHYGFTKRWDKYWNLPCGAGYYRTFGGAWGWKDNGWRGGVVNSTMHKLP